MHASAFRALLAAAGVACSSLTGCSSSVAQVAPEHAAESFGPPRALLSELDALIDQLPPIEAESHREDERWIVEPQVALMRWKVEHGEVLTAEQWQRALERIGAIRMRRRVPVGEPVAISMRTTGWLVSTRIRMVPRNPALEPAEVGVPYTETCGNAAYENYERWIYQALGYLEEGRHELVFDVTIERGVSLVHPLRRLEEPHPPQGVIWTGPMRFEVEVVPTRAAVVPPVSSPALDRAVRGSLSVAFRDWVEGRTAFLVVDPDRTKFPELANTALALSIELREGEELRHAGLLAGPTVEVAAWAAAAIQGHDRPIAFTAFESVPTAMEQDPSLRRPWTLRVRGTSDGAQWQWEADRYWSGELEVPLDELIEREREREPQGRFWPTWTR